MVVVRACMLSDIIFRPACSRDAPAIARLMIDASSGMLEFLFAELAEGMTAEEILASAIAQEEGNLSYQSTIVVEKQTEVIAIAFYQSP